MLDLRGKALAGAFSADTSSTVQADVQIARTDASMTGAAMSPHAVSPTQEPLMEYVLTFNQPAAVFETQADPVKGPPALMAWKAYMDDVAAAGVMRGGNRLSPFSATTVTVRAGKRQVQDGPFADSKDLLGGYIVIDVPTLDDAIAWAAKSPSSLNGSTEVRAVMAMAPTGS
jgi:hypothetical protein